MSAADWGLSDVAGAAVAPPVVSAGTAGADGSSTLRDSPPGGEKVSLLKLYANSFLQRAQGAQFFGSDERERAPG